LYRVADRKVKYVEHWWNDTDSEKTQVLGKISIPLQFFPLQIRKWSELGSTPVICNYSLESDRLAHENGQRLWGGGKLHTQLLSSYLINGMANRPAFTDRDEAAGIKKINVVLKGVSGLVVISSSRIKCEITSFWLSLTECHV
jgi:hypothetical protein